MYHMPEPSFESTLPPERERFESAVASQTAELEVVAVTPLQAGVASIIEAGSKAVLEQE